MENGKWKMENERSEKMRRTLSVNHFSLKNCPACGAKISRETAQFCNVCGKLLSEEYQPLDNLRASYNLQGKSFDFKLAETSDDENLFGENKNAAAQTAWACFVYSLVPYLGILFIPLTFAVSVIGYRKAVLCPHLGGRQMSAASFYLSFVVLSLQILLWWLLYYIPKIPTI